MQSTAEPPVGHEELVRVLTEAQRIGTLGSTPISETIRHSAWFADTLPADMARVIDLGSGAGVPGLIVAIMRPTVQVTLVDRRTKCADALHRAVHALGLSDRVTIRCADADDLSRLPDWRRSFDAAISRGFGPPLVTLTMSALFVRVGGIVVISEPPDHVPDRWAEIELTVRGLSGPRRVGPLAVFHVEHHFPDS